jgi:tetratricopeptide (TPR) repeat protein
LLAGTALATGCQTVAGLTNAAAQTGGSKDCYGNTLTSGPDFTAADELRLRSIADRCVYAADNTDSIRQRTTALFHAGRANLEMGSDAIAQRRDAPAGYGLPAAATQLELVVGNTRYEALPAKGGDKARNDLAGLARLELARTYKLQARYANAIDTLDKMINAAPSLPNAAAKLELARVYLARSRDGAVQDGSLEKAVGYLDVFSSDLKGEDPTLVATGRAELVEAATKLGLAMMNAPASAESSQRAIDAFSKAEKGALASGGSAPAARVGEIYVRLGQAKLRMAGLPSAGASTEFQCESKADTYWLGEAEKNFTQALAKSDSAEANAGMGCARQAIAYQSGSRPTDAVAWYEKAVARDRENLRYQLSYASALGATGNDATAAFQRALNLARNKTEEANIHVEIAKIYLNKGQTDAAIASAQNALNADKSSGAAHLVLGKAYYADRAGKPSVAWAAKRELDAAVAATRLRAEQKPLYADALYHRSLLSMEAPTTAPTTAVRDATEAVNTIDRPEYKEQACLAIVRFMNTALVADGKIRCSAELTNDTVTGAKGLLMEGMFFLATTRVPGIDRDKGWEWALNSFEQGVSRIGTTSLGEGPDIGLLRAKLRVGEAISYSCVGLRERGLATMRDVDVNYQAQAEQYFVRYNVKNCTR